MNPTLQDIEADRIWWEEHRRLEVDAWRTWALKLLSVPPDEADEPTSESLRAALSARLHVGKALGAAKRLRSSKPVDSRSLEASRASLTSALAASAMFTFLSPAFFNSSEGKPRIMIEVGSVVVLNSSDSKGTAMTVMAIAKGDGTASGRLCRVSWEMSPGRIETRDDVPIAALKLRELPAKS
jgi:hypothetical protein